MSRLLSTLLIACMVSTTLFAQEESISVPDVTTYIKGNTQEQRIFIDKTEIEELKPESAVELLESLGFGIKSNGGYATVSSVWLRGLPGKDTVVTIDGIAVKNPSFGTFDFNTIPVSQIQSIEVIKGGFTSNAGIEGGAGGVINIVTKKQAVGTSGYVDVSGLTYFNNPADRGSIKAGTSIGMGNSTISVDANATYANNNFTYKDDNDNSHEMDHARVIDGGASAQFLHYFDNGNELLIRDNFYMGDLQINGPDSAWGNGEDLQRDIVNSLLLSFNMPSLLENWAFKSTMQYDYNNREAGIPLGTDKYLLNTLQTTNTAHYSNSMLDQSFGINVATDFIDFTSTTNDFLLRGFAKSTTMLTLSNRFSVTIPLTLSVNDENIAFVPKLGLQYGFDAATVSLNGYRLHAFPTIADLYSSYGNSDLKTETGWGGEITANIHGIAFPFSTSIFANYYENRLIFDSIQNKTINGGKSFYTGADVLIDNRITDWLALRANYQFVISRSLNDGNTFNDNISMIYTPKHTAALGATFYWNILSIAINGNYVGERDYDDYSTWPTSKNTLDHFFLLDIAINAEVTDMITVYTKLDNVTNQMYELSADYPTPGISATLGMRLNIGE